MLRTELLISTTLALAASAFLPAPAQTSPFRVGEPAPELTLPSVADGSRRSLADFRGRRVMLHVWASW